jgi:hypothetical protein
MQDKQPLLGAAHENDLSSSMRVSQTLQLTGHKEVGLMCGEDGETCQALRVYRADAALRCDRDFPCRRQVEYWLLEADARGDGPLVNALCVYGRRRWGPGMCW